MKQIAFELISLSSLLASAGAVFAADAALVEAAKKEGHVTWYTVQIVDQIVRPIVSGFERKYGIHVDYVRANSAQLAVRISNEAKANQVQASLFDGTGATVALKRENLVEKWVPDADLPKNLFDPEGYWVACNYYINTPGFNTDLVPRGTEPKTFEDLLDPKWKGKMAWNVQPSVSAGQGFVGSVLIAMGEEKARAYLAKLAKQNITPLNVSGRQVLDLVIAGEYPIALADIQQSRLHQREQGCAGRLDQDAAAAHYLFGHVRTQGRAKPKRWQIADRLYRIARGAKGLRRRRRTARASRRQTARSHARTRRRDLQGVVSHPRRSGPESRTLDESVQRVFSLKLSSPQCRRLLNGTLR